MMKIQKEADNIDTLVNTVLWIAENRFKNEPYQDINSAILSVLNDIGLGVSSFMSANKKQKGKADAKN